MKKTFLSIIFIFAISAFSTVSAQRDTPAGAGDKNLAEDGVKLRSVEIERMKREAAQATAASFAPINTKIETKFPEIKEDFESIQISQAAIIKAYTTGKTIDYGLIETSANGINKNAKRLDSNLFTPKAEKEITKEDEKTTPKPESKKPEKPPVMQDLIVELDNAVGSFISSKIFGNLRVIEPEVAIKTRTDLLLIQELSEKLAKEAKRLKQ